MRAVHLGRVRQWWASVLSPAKWLPIHFPGRLDLEIKMPMRSSRCLLCLLISKGVLWPMPNWCPWYVLREALEKMPTPRGKKQVVTFSTILSTYRCVCVADRARLRFKFCQPQSTYPSPGPALTLSHIPPQVFATSISNMQAMEASFQTAWNKPCTQVSRNANNPYLPTPHLFHS